MLLTSVLWGQLVHPHLALKAEAITIRSALTSDRRRWDPGLALTGVPTCHDYAGEHTTHVRWWKTS